MAKNESVVFVCKSCGNEFPKWMGQCPTCHEWNTIVEATGLAKNSKTGRQGNRQSRIVKSIGLTEIGAKTLPRKSTGVKELDNVLGGGMVAGQVILLTGEPGIGKSTLLLQVATAKIQGNGSVLYVCGEESPEQIALRAKRLQVGTGGIQGSVILLPSTDVDVAVEAIEKGEFDIVVVDSIQMMTASEATGIAGSPSQVRESAMRLLTCAKEKGVAMFMVGHVTKDGDIAGPRILEHMVDTVLWFEGERSRALRMVRTIKNRFGSTDEVGVFRMTASGLVEVLNPSEYLLEERVKKVPGSVVSVVMEGTRPLLVEVQALTVPTQLPIPRRVATGVDFNRLQMLVAILTKKANLNLSATDVFVNVVGGFKVTDPGLDLAVSLAIASAYRDKPMADNVAAVGEVGLMGEVRKVADLEKRIKEAKKLGYKVASAVPGKMVGEAVKRLIA